ncbi:hypothetical protein Y032_0201g1714 [Ancylostoma ceylanicum]|uniref:Uncharacterized protein n=1 Tax=Ancylostoma ceylanicum TaxID=53326 RepID=A0A016SNA3_9BILA|nr:hypothetical protein Y032_0201g1714 [Ancylostoma ceylanicum]
MVILPLFLLMMVSEDGGHVETSGVKLSSPRVDVGGASHQMREMINLLDELYFQPRQVFRATFYIGITATRGQFQPNPWPSDAKKLVL